MSRNVDVPDAKRRVTSPPPNRGLHRLRVLTQRHPLKVAVTLGVLVFNLAVGLHIHTSLFGHVGVAALTVVGVLLWPTTMREGSQLR